MNSFRSLVLWNLRWERGRLVALSLASALFTGLLVALSGVIEPAEFQEFFSTLPSAIQGLVGMQRQKMFSIDRWVAIAHSHPVWIVLVLIYPLIFASSAFARRMEDGSMEAILAQPVARSTYYLAAALSTLVGIVAIGAASALGGIVSSQVADLPQPLSKASLLRHAVSGAGLATSVGGFALLVAALLAGRARPGAWSLGAVVALYFAEYLARIWPAFAPFGPISMFHYHDPHGIATSGLSAGKISVLYLSGLVFGTGGLLVFRRRALLF